MTAKHINLIAMLFVSSLWIAPTAFAQLDLFLKMDVAGTNLPGESTDEQHPNWIDLLSMKYGAELPSLAISKSGGPTSTDRAEFYDIEIVKYIDKTSPKMIEAMAKGATIKTAVLESCLPGGDKTRLLHIKFEEVYITSVSQGSNNGGKPIETITLNFGKITLTYTELDPDTGQPLGDYEFNWNCNTNRGSYTE